MLILEIVYKLSAIGNFFTTCDYIINYPRFDLFYITYHTHTKCPTTPVLPQDTIIIRFNYYYYLLPFISSQLRGRRWDDTVENRIFGAKRQRGWIRDEWGRVILVHHAGRRQRENVLHGWQKWFQSIGPTTNLVASTAGNP